MKNAGPAQVVKTEKVPAPKQEPDTSAEVNMVVVQSDGIVIQTKATEKTWEKAKGVVLPKGEIKVANFIVVKVGSGVQPDYNFVYDPIHNALIAQTR